MRVAIFSDSVLPVLNGVSVSLDLLVSELRDEGHSVHLFAPRYPGHREADPNTYRFRSLSTPFAKGFPIAYPPFIRMLRKFRRHDFDIVHTHTIGAMGFVGLRWAESHDLPIVSTYHTLYDRYSHYLPFLPRRYVRFKIAKHTNWYYNRVDHVITPSEASLRWLRRHSISTQVTVIPTGSRPPLHSERAEARAALGIPPEHKILLFVGRLAIEKNMDTLFEAAAQAIRQDASLRLWLVGDGPYRSACQTLARKLGIGDRVRFVGFVRRGEVDRFYSAADLFVFTSFTETQGLVIQEALSHGLPPVLVDGGGAGASIIHAENGLLVRNDAREFSEAVLSVLRDEALYSHLSRNASKSVRANSSRLMVERTIDVYREVLSERSLAGARSYAGVF